jgi:hypothetical protein
VNDHGDLKEKIAEAKRRLPLPELLSRLGLGEHANKTARCPFPGHEDKHPSFSVFRGEDGFWRYMCFSKCGDGDEIMFLSKLKGLPLSKAMNLYLEMAGFPASSSPKSHEYPKCPASPVCPVYPVYPVYPVSNGQGLEEELKGLAGRKACTRAQDEAESKRFKLARDLCSVEKRLGRKLTPAELRGTSDEWERISLPFLDWNGDDHFALLVAEVTKVRVPTGEGDTVNKALEAVSKLPASDLPVIPGYADARKAMRKLAALHREMSRRCGSNIYFLSYRHAAKVCDELSPTSAHKITLALERFGVIKIVSKGKRGLNSRKAAEFRYLLSESGKGGNCCVKHSRAGARARNPVRPRQRTLA